MLRSSGTIPISISNFYGQNYWRQNRLRNTFWLKGCSAVHVSRTSQAWQCSKKLIDASRAGIIRHSCTIYEKRVYCRCAWAVLINTQSATVMYSAGTTHPRWTLMLLTMQSRGLSWTISTGLLTRVSTVLQYNSHCMRWASSSFKGKYLFHCTYTAAPYPGCMVDPCQSIKVRFKVFEWYRSEELSWAVMKALQPQHCRN